jgi:probable HAF family extracellular repeat protein
MGRRSWSSVRRIALTGTLAAGLALVGSTFAPVQIFADSPAYTVADLGTLGGCLSVAKAVNNSGDIVGYSLNATEPMERPFIYRNGAMTAISNSYGWGTGINDAGQATGFVSLPGHPNVDAFLYQGGVLTDLGGLPGYSNQPYSAGYAINSAGTIVGDSKAQGMIYANGQMSGFSRQNARIAYGINDSGTIVGMLTSNHAFAFSGNNLRDIGTIDGQKDSVTVAVGVNNGGIVTGYGWLLGGAPQHAFVYDSNQGTMRDLGTLRGGYSFAMGINSAGDIVGESDGSAFLYRSGVMIDLNATLGGALGNIATALAINDRGQIVGQAWFTNDPSACGPHAFLLTPMVQ